MNQRRRVLAGGAAAAWAALGLPRHAMAQGAGYPNRPIRIVVPFPPGIPLDVILRVVGQRLSTSLGQPVVIENKPGAGGNIGTEFAARARVLGPTEHTAADAALTRKYGMMKRMFDLMGRLRGGNSRAYIAIEPA